MMARVRDALKAFHNAYGPALNRFRHEQSQRWPQIRHPSIAFEDASGHSKGGMFQDLDDEPKLSDGDFTHVMVRLRAPELKSRTR